MTKAKIIRKFLRMPRLEQKENFMREHNVRFEYDCHHNMTVYAEDGTLQLFPIIKEA